MRYALKTLLLLTFLSASFAFSNLDANAQTFLPVGPQTNVPVATVTGGGWTECYRDLYGNVFLDPDVVLPQCPGDRLMLACRQTGSPTLQLLAQGARSDVTFDTGTSETSTHIANGVGWYFNFPGGSAGFGGQNAWGFVRAGDSVNKNNCDLDVSGANNERLCWHLQNTIGGFRCGADTFLNDSTSFERIVYSLSQSITLSPETATNEVLTEHTVIATVSIDGVPIEGVLVDFEIIAGPNVGETSDPGSGECSPNDDCTTDANGQVSWTYSGGKFEGTDTIVATTEDLESNTVEKIWVIVRNVPTLSEWGLIAMAGVLGIIGLMALKRRKAAA